ncbi:uncharacterized protein [Spinacia oleracea]|uniref:Aminotransferase-like plant mobile domain-containing protein n=1 Tax=Spinacia oleracea TaxID=3562 RepID=A0ABM3QPZ5_SPIOL|nr:uncharacterized protein LOC130461352 [Spinacia oleracea]
MGKSKKGEEVDAKCSIEDDIPLTTTLLNLRNKKKKEKEITPTIDADLLEDINKEISETEEEEESELSKQRKALQEQQKMVQALQEKLLQQEKQLDLIEQKKKGGEGQKNSSKDPEKQEETEKKEHEVKVHEEVKEPEKEEAEVKVPEELDEPERKEKKTNLKITLRKKKDGEEAGEEPEKAKGKSRKSIPNRKRTRSQLLKEEFPDLIKEVKQELEEAHKKKSLLPAEKISTKKVAPNAKKGNGVTLKKTTALKRGSKVNQIVVREVYEDEEDEEGGEEEGEEVEEESEPLMKKGKKVVEKRATRSKQIVVSDEVMEVVDDEKPKSLVVAKPKPEERKLNLRQTPQLMMRFLRGIASNEPHDIRKQQAIVELGFGSLLQLDIPQNENPFPYELVRNFNSSDRSLHLPKSSLDITVEDVYLVYGIPIGGAPVVEWTDEQDPEVLRVFAEFWAYWQVKSGCPKLKEMVEKLIKDETPVDDNWKRSFLVVAVNTCIKSTTNLSPNFRFLASTVDLEQVRNLNWCQYAYTSLLGAAMYWNVDRSRWFAGPLPFLMVCYFDRVQIMEEYPPRNFPLISCWTRDMISSRVRNDNATGFGHGLILDRIQGPPELQLYREEMELLKQQKALSEQPPPLLLQHPQQQQQQHDEQPSQQPLQQPQQQHQHQEPNWSTNDVPREHQGAPVTQLGDDKDLPEQQADPSEKAKVPSTIEEFHAEFTKTTTELSSVMNKFNDLLSLSRKFFDTTIDVKKSLPFNMAKMWSTCSGTEIPVTFEKGNSTEERQEGRNTEEIGSILSQDKEFFSSDYFTILFEEAVRKATEGNERKEIKESEDVTFDLPPFLTPPIMPSQPNVFADLTLKLGMVSDSNPPPQAHDFEEEMRLEAILANKTLTERDLETISGDNKDEAEKQQPPTEKTEYTFF